MNPPPPHHRRLCHVITSYIEHFELKVSKKMEKQLLISLSQVLKQIQVWTNVFDSDSDEVLEAQMPVSNSKSSSKSDRCHNNHDCLIKIIGDMVLLLSVESQFIQHLVGNILVAITDYFAAYESDWAHFVKSLCICLELAISNALLPSLDQPRCSNHDTLHAIITLQPKLKCVTWSSVACVVNVLRTMLKRMKQDIDAELFPIYLNSISDCIANVPWDVMDQKWKDISVSNASLGDKSGEIESRSMFHGTLIQLFCSLVNASNSEGADKFLNGHPIISQVSHLLPTLLSWCLGGGNRNCVRMYEYFRHKILMLMIRLGSLICFEDSLLFLWLDLIHEYFEDLLLLPMNQPDHEDTVEESPFITSTCDTNTGEGKSCHLQRLLVLLFLKCSFSLIGLTNRGHKQCGRKKGLSELHWWLQKHLPYIMLGGLDCYLEKCTSFSISFLRLFIHEDDILFELLLLLFSVPFNSKQNDGQEMNDDVLFHVANILNPLQLFHLFLSELHYDHQVLLDYLISKDTGASCAEYLLRSLRIVCDSWTEFVEFSLEGELTDMGERTKPSRKKRRVLADGYEQPFVNAKYCLLLLKETIQNLDQKELFLYNPKVLLRRFACETISLSCCVARLINGSVLMKQTRQIHTPSLHCALRLHNKTKHSGGKLRIAQANETKLTICSDHLFIYSWLDSSVLSILPYPSPHSGYSVRSTLFHTPEY